MNTQVIINENNERTVLRDYDRDYAKNNRRIVIYLTSLLGGAMSTVFFDLFIVDFIIKKKKGEKYTKSIVSSIVFMTFIIISIIICVII